jgi:hypothetical protein
MLPERMMTQTPDRMIMLMEDTYDLAFMEAMANAAVQAAKDRMPKITGHLASTLTPVFGPNFWGIYFPDKKTWFLERGTRPFTMNSLQGKTIPMWVDDPDGEISRKNKKAKTRITVDGRRQTLIFRKAAHKGERKTIRRNGKIITVPRSYPGAPGRIGNPRGMGGRIASGNQGVRWRHPGIQARQYLNEAIEDTADMWGIDGGEVYLIDAATYPTATKA